MWRVVEKCLQSNLIDSLLVRTKIGGKYHWLYRLWYISTTRNIETWEMRWFVWLHKREGEEMLCCTCTFCSFLWIPSKTAFSCRRWSIFILSWELVARELLNRTDDCHHGRRGRETHRQWRLYAAVQRETVVCRENRLPRFVSISNRKKVHALWKGSKRSWKIIKDDLQTAKMDFLLNIFPLYIQYMQ